MEDKVKFYTTPTEAPSRHIVLDLMAMKMILGGGGSDSVPPIIIDEDDDPPPPAI